MLAHALDRTPPFRRPALRRPLRLVVMQKPPSETAALNALVAAVAMARDRAAFQALFAHFAPRIKAYLMRQGAPAAQAEDLAQEAMLSVWRKAHLFDPAKAAAGTWIFTIARNLRIDVLRRERRPELDASDPMLAPQAEPDADDGITLAAGAERLRAALKLLPADQAQVIALSFFEDKPHSQIASELSIPLGTVKSRLRLAMTRLRAAVGDAL